MVLPFTCTSPLVIMSSALRRLATPQSARNLLRRTPVLELLLLVPLRAGLADSIVQMGYQKREQSVIGKSVLKAQTPLIQSSFRDLQVFGVGIAQEAVGPLKSRHHFLIESIGLGIDKMALELL